MGLPVCVVDAFADKPFAGNPADGISEDPVTGSAHCSLGPYWPERLKKPLLTAWSGTLA